MKYSSGFDSGRRDLLRIGSVTALSVLAVPLGFLSSVPVIAAPATWEKLGVDALPPQESYEAALKRLFGGRTIEYLDEETLKFTTPNVAENGAVVPVEVELLNAPLGAAFVKAVYFLVEKNKRPHSATFVFSSRTGAGYAATYLRMGGTSWVHAVLESSDAKLLGAKREVKVVAGGCGG